MSMLLRRHHQKSVDKPKKKEEPKPVEFPQATGGGWFVLSNGDKVQGKDEAKKAQEELGD